MRGRILTALFVLMLGVATLGQLNAGAAAVTPAVITGNPSCTGLGYTYGLKPNAGTAQENTPNGTFYFNNGVDSVTVDANGSGLDSWTSTIGVDAVIIKGGPNANVYTYNPESLGDSNLVTPTNPNNNQPFGLSHVEFCYDYELGVSKTAAPTYDRTWSWTIDKTGDQTALTLSQGQTYTVNYVVSVNASSSDSNYGVNGAITIHNPDPFTAANITSITDQISGLLATTPVDCAVSLPYSLAPGGTLVCTYSQQLPDNSTRTNTATVVSTGVPGGSGSAQILFGAPTTLIDECVDVSDTYPGVLGTVCANSDTLPYTFNYSRVITATTCGETQYPNTASFVTNDSSTTGSDSWNVTVTVPCVLGCTLTQGYWKTHSSFGPAPYDNTWAQLANGASTTFYLSGKSWYQVFWTPPQGNPYYNLAHQFMAAQLNVLNGADQTAVSSTMTAVNTWFSTAGNTPTKNFSKTEKQQLLTWATTLDRYNNGLTGPGHCSEQ